MLPALRSNSWPDQREKKKRVMQTRLKNSKSTAIQGREDECEQPAQFNCVCPASVGSRACTGVAIPTIGDEASRHNPEAQLVWGENGKAYGNGQRQTWLAIQRHSLSCPSSLDGQTELGPHVCVHHQQLRFLFTKDLKVTKVTGPASQRGYKPGKG